MLNIHTHVQNQPDTLIIEFRDEAFGFSPLNLNNSPGHKSSGINAPSTFAPEKIITWDKIHRYIIIQETL